MEKQELEMAVSARDNLLKFIIDAEIPDVELERYPLLNYVLGVLDGLCAANGAESAYKKD